VDPPSASLGRRQGLSERESYEERIERGQLGRETLGPWKTRVASKPLGRLAKSVCEGGRKRNQHRGKGPHQKTDRTIQNLVDSSRRRPIGKPKGYRDPEPVPSASVRLPQRSQLNLFRGGGTSGG